MNKLKNKNGITLVALIITIIVLLILAMVSIRLVMNGGIIDRAEKGTKAYSESEIQEQIKLAYSEWQTARWTGETRTAADFVKARLNQTYGENAVTDVIETNGVFSVVFADGREYTYNVASGQSAKVAKWNDNGDGSWTHSETGSKIQIGDIVNYETVLASNAVDSTKKAQLISDLGTYSGNTDSSQNTDSSVVRDSLTWKVLDVKDGKIRLISSAPTTSKIRLENANGYNNAVYLLDKACDTLYSSNKGTAQNLKIEDIESKLSTTGISARDNFANSYVDTGKYGGTKEYTSNLQYPKIYPSEIGCKAVATADNTGNTLGLSEQTSPVTGKSTATNRLKVTQTYWYKSMATSDFTDSKYYNLFINNGTSNYASYWLSSRCVICDSGAANFTVRYVGSGNVSRYVMFDSYGYSDGDPYAFRPVVSLESNIQLSGDSTNGWTIQ